MKSYFHIMLLGGLIFLAGLTSSYAQSFVTNGSASNLGGDCYQITPDNSGQAGSIFSQNTIDLTQPFSEEATFFFGCKDGNGADGIVFILATTNTALGVGGGGLGYQGITPSIAIEYDDYQNGNYGDPASDHMAVISMGSVNHNLSSNFVGPINISNIEDCMDHCFTVSWNPTTLTLQASLDDNVISYTGNIVANIFGGNAQVYYGFSSGTGSLANLHRVCFGPPSVMPMPDDIICEGESASLQADPNGIAWTWAPDPTLSSLSISNPVATPDVTTTYTTIIEYNCGFINYDTVVVTVIPLPVAFAGNDGPICLSEMLTLMGSGGTTYQWSGPMSFSSSSQNPVINNVTPGHGGIYTLTVTDAAGCTDQTTTLVVIDEGPVIDIDPLPQPICINHPPFQLTASPFGGFWTGDISGDGLFDPDYADVGIHIVTYTVTNSNGCSNTEEVSIEVLPIPEVLIDPPGIICENSSPVQMTGSPLGGIWSGEISFSGLFDPSTAGSGPHLITYTANDGDGCTNSAQIIVEVVPGLTAEITPIGPFCTTETDVQLTASPAGGVWGGVANSMGIIFPSVLGPGIHEVVYTLNDAQGCFFGQVDIEVFMTPSVEIDPINPLCANASVQVLTANPPGGVWGGAANANGEIDPVLLGPGTHIAFYSQTNAGGCTGADTLSFNVFPGAPMIDNLNISCDTLSTVYVVSFTISGGDSISYNVQGSVGGNLMPGSPSIFTSLPITTGSPYIFTVDDINGCDPDTISGMHNCDCATNAGMMSLATITACEGDTIFVSPPTGVNLETDDSLVYVLHLGFPGNILMVSDTNFFPFVPPLQTGISYFVSTVAGNASSGIGVDLNDACLSVSFGTPIRWTPPATGSISATSPICDGESTSLIFTLSGGGPYNILYSEGSTIFSVDSVNNGFSVIVNPTTNTTYTLLEVEAVSLPGCTGFPDTTATVIVNDITSTSLTAMICQGDSILLGGDYQMLNGIYLDTLSGSAGCDSILETTLMVSALDTSYLSLTSCDTMQAGVFTDVFSDQFGCDSTVITTVNYVLADTTLLYSNTCDQLDSGIFTDYYTGQNGCDSVVIEEVVYLPPDTTLIQGTTCDEMMAGTFIRVLLNIDGCDSVIIESILYTPADTTYLTGETCLESESGVFETTLTNSDGCDSLIISTIDLLPSDTLAYYFFTCLPQDTGLQIQVYTNVYGCDSLVFTNTILAPYDSCYVPPKDVFIPNVFSPNDDGINDFFSVYSNSGAVTKIAKLRIYDRWGGLVVELNDLLPNIPTDGWDGTQNGETMMPGVFVWVVQLEFADGSSETRSGDVTLVR